MNTDSTLERTTTKEPGPPAAHYCNCAIPLAVERAERRGAAVRVCARCELPIPVRWSRW